jgi:hypothetical protein
MGMDKGQYMPEVARFSSARPPIGCRATENNLNSIKGYALSLSLLPALSFSPLEQITSEIASSRGEDEVRSGIGVGKFLLLSLKKISRRKKFLGREIIL